MAQVLKKLDLNSNEGCPHMRRDSGFTALEVAITLVIVAVLATVVMPSFLKWLQAHRLRGAAINLVADLEMAKVRAIREGSFVSIEVAATAKISSTTALADGWGYVPHRNREPDQYRQLPAGSRSCWAT
jgi:type IV fimbrial biogenesis protein FimT